MVGFMKHGYWAVGLAIIGLGLSEAAWSQGFEQVISTSHNLLSPSASARGDLPCEYCHIEGTSGQPAPKWQKSRLPASYSLVHEIPPPLGKGTPETRPYGPSFDCLTCHDGVLGNNVHQTGFSGPIPAANPMAGPLSRLQSPDHPDSILYPRQPDGRFSGDRADPKLMRYWSIPDRTENGLVLPTGPKSAALNLQGVDPNDPSAASALLRTYKGVIHCDTCHNPHANITPPFLRIPNKTLCLACHDR